MLCPIIRMEISESECHNVAEESYKGGKDKQAKVSNKFKRIIGWKAICKQCKHHEKVD